jgi:hypothetical protein
MRGRRGAKIRSMDFQGRGDICEVGEAIWYGTNEQARWTLAGYKSSTAARLYVILGRKANAGGGDICLVRG